MEDKMFDAWIAGFWEGEGSIYKRKEGFGYLLTITQTIRDRRTTEICMEKIQKKFKGSIYTIKDKNKNHNTVMRWQLTNMGDVFYFLRTIYPYCHIRGKDVEDALRCFKDKNTVILEYRKDGVRSQLCVMS